MIDPVRVAGRVVLPLLLAASATAGFAAPDNDLLVAGRQSSDARSITIAVRDLNLSNPADRNTLAIRINNAAREVCDIHDGSKLDTLPAAQTCYQQARAGALAMLDSRGIAATAAVAAAGMR